MTTDTFESSDSGDSSNTLIVNVGTTMQVSGIIGQDLVDNGIIQATSLVIGEPVLYSFGYGAAARQGTVFGSTISGTGILDVMPAGTLTLQAPVYSAGLNVQLDGSASLIIEADIIAGNTIYLAGGGNNIAINGQYYVDENPAQYVEKSAYYSSNSLVVATQIVGFNASDTLTFLDNIETNTVITSAVYNNGSLNLIDDGTVVCSMTLIGDYSQFNFEVGTPTPSKLSTEDQQIVMIQASAPVSCFISGTHIKTPNGDISIECLKAGDTVIVGTGESREIIWIGRRSVNCASYSRPEDVYPFRVVASAFSSSSPSRDLFLSPDHAVYIDGVLIPIKYLANGKTIYQIQCESVEYFHIKLSRHNVIYAEGLLCETFLGDEINFYDNEKIFSYRSFSTPQDQCAANWEARGYAPLLVSGDLYREVKLRLADRARECF